MKSNPNSTHCCRLGSIRENHDDGRSAHPPASFLSHLWSIQAKLAQLSLGFLLIHSADAVQFSDFQAVYEFNNSANLGADSSGKNNTLVVDGGSPAYSTSGRFGGALSLNGSSSMKLTTFPIGFPSGNSSYTIAMWVKPDSDRIFPDLNCPTNATILSWGVTTSNGALNSLALDGDKNGVNNNWWFGDFRGGMRSGSFFDGNYHLIVATWDNSNSTRTIAIDGIIVNKRTVTNAPSVAASNFVIGAGFKGLIDNVMIANTAMSDSDLPTFWKANLSVNNTMYTTLSSALDMAGSDQNYAFLSGGQAITNSGASAKLFIGFDQSSWQLSNVRPEFPTNQTPTSTFTGGLNSASIRLVKLGRGTQILQTNQNFLTASTLVQGGRLELDASKLQSNIVVAGSTTFGSVPPEFGGKGSVVGNVTLNTGSNMVLYTSGVLDINGSLLLNNNKVRLNLPTNLGTGIYPLCKYLIAGSSGFVAPIPEILSGSFASTTTFKVETAPIIGNVTQKQIQLVVTNRDVNSSVVGVNVYPPVPGLTPSNRYSVRVRRNDSATIWNSVFVFQTKAEPDRFPHGYFNSLKNYSHSYVNFEMSNSLPVVIEIKKLDGNPFYQLPAVRPSNKATVQLLDNNYTLNVTLSNPCNISVDIDGQMENAHTGGGTASPIHTFSIHANPMIADKPDINALDVLQVEPGVAPTPTQLADATKKTVYFKPGMHHLGVDVQLYSDKNYYIPGDAIVYATFNNLSPERPANKIRIFGHGTISGERFYHWNDTPGGQSASQLQRPIDMNYCSNVKLEGITVADSANNSILVASSTNYPFPANEVTWLKVLTWRVNGDGGGCSDNSEVNNCFMRTQDDGLYVNGRNVSDTVLWNDVNGTPMRMSALPNLTDRVFTVKNIDVVYSRKDPNMGSTPLGLPGDPSTATRGQNVVFSNINVSDPYPSGSLLAFDQNGGTLSGIRFENVTMASATNAYLQKSTLNAQNGGQIQNLNFYNLKFGSTTVTAANYLTYFEVTQLGGSVQTPNFTDSLGSSPKVSVTSTLSTASEPSNNVKFTFTRTGSTTLALGVAYSVIGKATNGTDYTTLSGSVTIPAGAKNATVTLAVLGDTLDEGNENVAVLLSASPNYVISWPSNATVDIIDGDLGGGTLSRARWIATGSTSLADVPKALDFDTNSQWISYDSQAPGQFFQVDMDSIQSFNRIEITSPGGDDAIELEVVVSNDGLLWSSPIASVFGGGATTKIHFPIQNARFIKLIQKGTATGLKWWRIADLKVSGPFDGRAWVPTASHNTGDVKLALDGNLATRWSTNTFQVISPEQWFQVDMNTPRNFDTIYLNTTQSNGGSYNDFPVGYQVLVSDTGTDWTTQPAIATGAGTSQITKIVLATPVTKRYMRIKQTGSSPTNYWSIVEFHVFPTVNYGISSPWKIQDIGSVGQPGSFSVSGTKWTLGATGSDIWNAPDSFQYVNQSFSGITTTVSSKVAKIVSDDGWARAGVMIRESSSPSALYAMLCWTSGNGLQFQWRDSGSFSGNVRIKEIVSHSYLRINRVGDIFTPSTSADGVTWIDATKDADNTPVTQTISMITSGVKGLIVCSHQNGPPPVLKGTAFEPITPAP